ncbi:DUF551 domain-containing protein [Enterobacter hormaechei subsp. xiangfangensis]|uniref:DUF551 domain-containing protein n=1 Tax=Enterobacter hormaechei TaxID=158836 RepID=UPI002875CC8A|nr:DUF551 domain-containing protein [Enterobacter hormaechei]MDR9922893.1 DUF551 domain-containing protein [Enterobacter hormaechei subsp. xiangfangensis]MDS0007213.1 DUF551 domain-containing protein [Enterobacter hormaechei subsp. xiangfangensis]MDS0049601.1 DUF551 domain-containing protein [Enterobacter hormaechei subsp. xiangfangensis]
MITFTKEQLIASAHARIEFAEMMLAGELELLKERTWSIELELARIVLASLEAEPVAWLLSGGGAKNNVSFDSGNAYADPLREVTPLYTAPPAPVSVPDEVCWEDVPEEITEDDMALASAWAHGFNQCRAAMLKHSEPFIVTSDHRMMEMPQVEAINAVTAMLQGADGTLTNEGTIPVTQFKPVADLYGLTSPTGGETSFTFDAVEARDFIDGGWSCQEYVELERFQEAITNHTEDKLAMVDHSGDANEKVEPVTTAYKLPANTPCKDAPEHIWLQTAGVWPENGEFSELTWCSDNQHKDDTLYVRADVVSGNSPVIPDGWVACSEQMPEDEQEVIVQNKMGYRYVSYFDEHSGLFFDMRGGNQMNCIEHIFVTHWMPLPAAPQQK